MPDDDAEAPFKVTKTEIECPHPDHDGMMIPIEIGWVNHDFPILHLNAPELVEHLKQHGRDG